MRPQRIPRAEQRIKTREAIIAAAGRLFTRQGIEATSIDAIAAELGLTKGAVYANFRSKAELIEAVAEVVASGQTLSSMLLRADLPLRERLRRFGREVVSGAPRKEVVLLDLEYVIYGARNRHWGKYRQERCGAGLNVLAAELRAVNLARGERPPITEERLVRMLNMLGRSIIQELTVDPKSLTVSDVEAMFMSLGGTDQPTPKRRATASSRRAARLTRVGRSAD